MLPQTFVQVVVDVPQLPPLTYLLEAGVEVSVGTRCVVPLGNREVVGMVVGVNHDSEVDTKRLKSVKRILSEISPVNSTWLSLTKFASDYYQHSWGEVIFSSLPGFFCTKPGVRYLQSLERYRKLPQTKGVKPQPVHLLNEEQNCAVEALRASTGFAPMVLHGVTGSGKTEVYLNMMQAVFDKEPEAQILFLVPEINLTPQLEARVRARFENKAVYALHSGLANGERARAWLALHEARGQILIGTRMAVFASLPYLKLIIVDEEHDLSYKAGDGVRFNARDLSIKLASQLDIPVVLGSATPSLETWFHVKRGHYACLPLKQRAVKNAKMPSLRVVNPKEEKTTAGLAQSVIDAICSTLARNEQVIVFINRRGYAPVVTCPSCGWLSTCPHCSTYAVFHKSQRRLICHHCGWSTSVVHRCPDCGNLDLQPLGAGTQKIEEQLQSMWPDARVMRLDRDTTARKDAAQKAFDAVHAGAVDILVGTQMIAKGHDFQKVSLVVVLNIDAQLANANPRSEERAFANLMQVAGRAGRAGLSARMIVQSRFGDRLIFKALAQQNYEMFADALLDIRRAEMTTPFVYQALLLADAPTLDKTLDFLSQAQALAENIREQTEDDSVMIFDPIPMAVVKVADRERGQLLIEGTSRKKLNAFLSAWYAQISEIKTSVHWVMDVDPIDV